MSWLRTLLFRLVFYAGSVLIVLAVPISGLIGRDTLIAHALFWSKVHRWCARAILGITSRIEGERPRPALYAAKHQAMYETLELALMLNAPAIVMKAELARIPIWGWAARRYGVIVIDRAGSSKALRQMMREAKMALNEGRSVLIFPEGTRVKPGEQPPLKAGFAGLYRMLGLPVVPVAIDSGRLLPKKGAKRPGIVTFRFGEALPPAERRAQIEAQTHAAINVLDR